MRFDLNMSVSVMYDVCSSKTNFALGFFPLCTHNASKFGFFTHISNNRENSLETKKNVLLCVNL